MLLIFCSFLMLSVFCLKKIPHEFTWCLHIIDYEILLMRPPEKHAWLDVDEDGMSHLMQQF